MKIPTSVLEIVDEIKDFKQVALSVLPNISIRSITYLRFWTNPKESYLNLNIEIAIKIFLSMSITIYNS